MTVNIPPMTKHARLCQKCLPKYIFLIVSRDDGEEFRQENRTKITITGSVDQSAKLQSVFPSYMYLVRCNHIKTNLSIIWSLLTGNTCTREGTRPVFAAAHISSLGSWPVVSSAGLVKRYLTTTGRSVSGWYQLSVTNGYRWRIWPLFPFSSRGFWERSIQKFSC